MERPSVLYLSYDGMLEPLGESQVLAYLERLARQYRITLISFEKPVDLSNTARVTACRERLRASGVRWRPLRYHKAPQVPATAYDVAQGVWHGWRCLWRDRIQIVHARGYVPALMAVLLKRVSGVRFLFDMRGFWADEKVDGGHWAQGSWRYRMAKRWERVFYESADAIVSLTHEGLTVIGELGYRLHPGIPLRVITTCADLDRFTPGPKSAELAASLGLQGRHVVGCIGTISNWYLRREMLEGLAEVLSAVPDATALLVTRDDHATLRHDARQAGIRDDRLVLAQAPFDTMPAYTRLMDLGLFFIKPCRSKRGSAATKLGEFLASGVPVLINDGIGDSGQIVREARCGVVLTTPTREAVRAALPQLHALLSDLQVSRRCRRTAEAHFNLADGVAAYSTLYTQLGHAEHAKPILAVAEVSS